MYFFIIPSLLSMAFYEQFYIQNLHPTQLLSSLNDTVLFSNEKQFSGQLL